MIFFWYSYKYDILINSGRNSENQGVHPQKAIWLLICGWLIDFDEIVYFQLFSRDGGTLFENLSNG